MQFGEIHVACILCGATHNGDGRRVGEVPHNLLRNLGIQRRLSLTVRTSDIAIRNFVHIAIGNVGTRGAAIPETPTSTHDNRSIRSSRIIDDVD